MPRSRTISLIGMPGAGKSTVGVLLAKIAGIGFVDADIEIQCRAKAALQDILDAQGYERLRGIEAAVIGQTRLEGNVIATGGSAVYSDVVMARLGAAGPVVYLEVDLPTLEARIGGQTDRGIASPPGQDLAQIYAERTRLYERYADLVVNCNGRDPQAIASDILAHVNQRF